MIGLFVKHSEITFLGSAFGPRLSVRDSCYHVIRTYNIANLTEDRACHRNDANQLKSKTNFPCRDQDLKL